MAAQAHNAAAVAVRVRERLAADRADLEHWRAVRAAQIADGMVPDFGRNNVGAGDRVQVREHWYPVVRANAKTVTVFGQFGLRTTPWQEVQAHKGRPCRGDRPACRVRWDRRGGHRWDGLDLLDRPRTPGEWRPKLPRSEAGTLEPRNHHRGVLGVRVGFPGVSRGFERFRGFWVWKPL